MLTRWGRSLDADAPLPEHPRPQLTRPDWASLNGVWECAFAPTGDQPHVWQSIVVPFSPESELSGVRRQLQPHETLHYRRSFDLPRHFADDRRVLLHLGAVDQRCRVRVNGRDVGGGDCGYLPITCDITGVVRRGGNELEVRVTDPSETGQGMRGKQRLDRGGIWYTATSGIWQSVWLEAVPESHVADVVLTPRLRFGDGIGAALEVTVVPGGELDLGRAHIEVVPAGGGRPVARAQAALRRPTIIPIPEPRLWRPDDPHLYEVRVSLGEDRITAYAALRDVRTGPDAAGVPRLLLNGEPHLALGVLDQGYWPDGMLTPPDDEAIAADLRSVRDLGFGWVRKHVKVEPLRWYHHADRAGLLVMQDIPNGGGPYVGRVISGMNQVPERPRRLHGRTDDEGRAAFERDLRGIIGHLRSVQSVAAWTLFNEGWGQFDTLRLGELAGRLDPTRPRAYASGWHDRGGGDIATRHEYLKPWRLPDTAADDPRVQVLAEYGGVGLPMPGHTWGEQPWGYADAHSADDLVERLTTLHREQLAPTIPRGLSGAFWTQLTDVEDEHNGLLTWDREVVKVPPAAVRASLQDLRSRL